MNAITRTAGGASTPPFRGAGTAVAEPAATRIAPARPDAQHPVLSDRPRTSASAGPERPRNSVINARASGPRHPAEAVPDVAMQASAAVRRQVDNGTVPLRGTHSAAAIAAAATTASMGLMALQRDFFGQADPPRTASP